MNRAAGRASPLASMLLLFLIYGCFSEAPNAFQVKSTFEGQLLEGVNPRHSPDGRWIAFTAFHNDLNDVAVIPISGGEATLLTSNGVSVQPTWSPDSSRIAFASSNADGSSDIFVIASAGGEARAITTGPGIKAEPDWSPDGQQIVFSGTDGSRRDWGVWTVPAEGGVTKRLTLHSADEWSPRWSADGDWIFYSTNQSIHVDIDIWKIRSSGGKPEAVTSFPGDEFSAAPSPDGKMIAYMTDTTGLWTMNLATGEKASVTPGENFYDILSWSPDGTSLVVGHNPYPVEVRSVGFDGTMSEISIDRAVKSPDVSPDGHQIVFWSIDDAGNGDIWKVATDGGTPAIRLTSHPTADFHPAWSPDGKWIAFVSRRNGSTGGDIWKIPTEGGRAQRLTRLNSARHPRWCDSGESLVFQSDPDDGLPAHIWSVSASGDSLIRITNGLGEVDPDCLGSQLTYAAQQNGGVEIVIRDMTTGNVKSIEFDQASVHYPRWSNDGSRMSFISNKSGKREIYTLSLRDGSTVRITDDGGQKSAPGWSPDGSSIFYSVQLGQQEIWQFPIP